MSGNVYQFLSLYRSKLALQGIRKDSRGGYSNKQGGIFFSFFLSERSLCPRVYLESASAWEPNPESI